MTDTAVKTFTIDTAHSNVEFSVRHLMISKVKGSFDRVAGTITLGEGSIPTALDASIEIDSISTRDAQRDGHLKSDDFFAAATYPTLTFASTAIKPLTATTFEITGNLTIKDVTKQVVFEATLDGRVTDGFGQDKAAYSATTTIDREEYGLVWNQVLEAGGIAISKEVTIELTIQAVAQASA